MRAKEMDKVRAEAGNIAVNMAEKLLRESLDDKYQAALVQSFLDKTGGKQ
jgi:F0F1-type ATP synthase membrane subunit b/b'